jgi:hypothetical protein
MKQKQKPLWLIRQEMANDIVVKALLWEDCNTPNVYKKAKEIVKEEGVETILAKEISPGQWGWDRHAEIFLKKNKK